MHSIILCRVNSCYLFAVFINQQIQYANMLIYQSVITMVALAILKLIVLKQPYE